MQWTWDEIRKLSVAERLILVEDIWDSIAQDTAKVPLTDAQKGELDRRWAAYKKNPSKTKSWAQVRRRLDRAK